MNPQEAIRMHRHDVLNHLQLVKGYLQLHRPDRALDSLNRLVEWLASLSTLQSQCVESFAKVLWTALACSHLRVEVHPETTSLPATLQNALSDALIWLEQATVVHNMEKLTVVLTVNEEGLLGKVSHHGGLENTVPDELRVELASTFPGVRWSF